MIKRIVSILKRTVTLAVLTVLLSQTAPWIQIQAAEAYQGIEESAAEADDTVSITAEETEMYFAVDEDGIWWCRLWSLTYGRWITDWMLLG